jgi:hypothetical protein
MTWLWSDDLARMLVDETGVDPSAVEWGVRSPFAVQVPDATEHLEIARDLFDIRDPVAGAA